MNVVLKNDTVSVTEYFAMLKHSNDKLELIDGQVYAMAGGSRRHARIIGNLFRVMANHLKDGACEVLSEFTVEVDRGYVYPDILVDCSNELNQADDSYATEPSIIVEVLSPSTMNYDLTKKFDMYKTIDSLQEYVVVEQNIMRIDIYRRSDDWNATRYEKGDDVEFQSIDLTVPIAEIYHRILFAEDMTAKKIRLARNVKADK